MADGFFLRRPVLGRLPLRGKKCWGSPWLILTGSEVSGREGNLGGFLGTTSLFAVQMLLGEVLARKSGQYKALAFLMALE